LGGLEIRNCDVGGLGIRNVKARDIFIYKFDGSFLSITDTSVAYDICMGETKISRSLGLNGLSYRDLELMGSDRLDVDLIKAKLVETDDPVIARQFELLRIRVLASTSAARKMVKEI
jgi:hypothetical protein